MFSTVKYWSVNSQYSRENRWKTLCNFDHYLHTMYAHASMVHPKQVHLHTHSGEGRKADCGLRR